MNTTDLFSLRPSQVTQEPAAQVWLSNSGTAFSDRDAAQFKADRMSAELGARFCVVPYEGGFAVSLEGGNGAGFASLSTPGGGEAPPLSRSEFGLFVADRAETVPELDPTKIPAGVEKPAGREKQGARPAHRSAKDHSPPGRGARSQHGRQSGRSIISLLTNGRYREEVKIRPVFRAFLVVQCWLFAGACLLVWPEVFLARVVSVELDPHSAAGAVLPGVVAIIGGGVMLYMCFRLIMGTYAYRYLITDSYIRTNYGIVSRERDKIRISDIRNQRVVQSIWERMLGYGHLELSTAGTANVEVRLENIAHPEKLDDLIERIRERSADADSSSSHAE